MTGLSSRAIRVFALVTALVVTGGAAWAFWAAAGAGAGAAATAILAPPSNVVGSSSASTVALSWTGTTAPAGGPITGYYVQRSTGAPAGTCASSPISLLAASTVSCSDTGISAGTYTYTVVAVYRSWTATATSAPVTVAPATAHHFQVTVPATATAGTALSVTVTAQDIANATFTGYSGVKSLVWSGPGTPSGGLAPTFPATVTFTNGVGTASVTLTKQEVTTLTATEGAVTGTSSSIVVSAGGAARLAWTQVTISGGTLSSPCSFTCTATGVGNFGTFTARVAVTDDSGNPLSNLGAGHTVTVSTPTSGATSGGSFTAPTPGTSVTLTIASSGAAESTAAFTFRATNGNWGSNTFTAATASGTSYTTATGAVTKQ